MDIGNAVKQLRLQRGLNQTEFAEQCGLSQSYLSSIEKNRKEPTLTILKNIANSLNIPTPVLVFFALEEDDIVDDSKKKAFTQLIPSIKNLIVGALLTPEV